MNEQIPHNSVPNYKGGALKIAGTYLIVGAAWILFSDRLAARIAPNEAVLTRISLYKGWGYVVLTAVLLYFLIRSLAHNIRKAEKQLYQAEARFRTLVEQMPAVTYTAALDETSTTTYISPQIEEMIGYSADEYLANPNIWTDLLHPEVCLFFY